MNATRLADRLDRLAGDLPQTPWHEIAVMLHRAAMCIRSGPDVPLLEKEEQALEYFMSSNGLSRPEAVHKLLVDALISAGYLSFHKVDEDGETEGSA